MKSTSLTLIVFLFSSHSFAMSSMPNHDCGAAKNGALRQISSLERMFRDKGLGHLFHKTSLVGKDDREIVPTDSGNSITRQANKIGEIIFGNGDGAGNAQLVSYKGKVFLVGSAHGVFKPNGARRVEQLEAEWSPNLQYFGVDEDLALKTYKFNSDPINADAAKNWKTNGVDLAIFEIDSSIADEIVFGLPRGSFELSKYSSKELFNKFNSFKTLMVSTHGNFHEGLETGFQTNCKIKENKTGVRSQLGLHNCDTGKGASGAALLLFEDGEYKVAGFHVGGRTNEAGGDFKDSEFESGAGSNRFVPIDLVKAEFSRLEREGKI